MYTQKDDKKKRFHRSKEKLEIACSRMLEKLLRLRIRTLTLPFSKIEIAKKMHISESASDRSGSTIVPCSTNPAVVLHVSVCGTALID